MAVQGKTHIDRALTNISIAYKQDAKDFVSSTIFPEVPVMHQTDVYYKYDKGDMFRNEMKKRGAGSEAAQSNYRVHVEEPYRCVKRALAYDITEEELANADSPLEPRRDATEWLMHKALIEKEVSWANAFFKQGIWTTEITGKASGAVTDVATETLKWSDPMSDPIQDINNAMLRMARLTARKPNQITLSPAVFYVLKNHEDIIDKIKYTQKGIVTADLIAQLFEVEKINVSWAVQNTAEYGEDENMEFIFGDHALLTYSPSAPGLRQISAGYTFNWKGLQGGGVNGVRVRRFPMVQLGEGTERVEVETCYDQKIVSQDCGCMFLNII